MLPSEHRVFIEDKASGNVLSPFHDIPLWANEQKVRTGCVVTGLPIPPCSFWGQFADRYRFSYMQTQTVLNMIVEVPRWTNAKMEISKSETLNPILQDTKKGKLRFVRNCFPHHGYIWNCGFLCQLSPASFA